MQAAQPRIEVGRGLVLGNAPITVRQPFHDERGVVGARKLVGVFFQDPDGFAELVGLQVPQPEIEIEALELGKKEIAGGVLEAPRQLL